MLRRSRDLLMLVRQIEASEYRDTLLAELESGTGATKKLDAEVLRRLLHKVTFEQQRKEFGNAPQETDETVTQDAVIQAALPAKVISRGGLVAASDDVEFEVVIDWERAPMDDATRRRFTKRGWKIQIDWVFERGDLRQIQQTESPNVTQRLSLPLGQSRGVWKVHAFVRTSHFWPTRLEPVLVEVKPQSHRMNDLREELLGGKDAELGLESKDHDFFGNKDELIGKAIDAALPGAKAAMGTDHEFEGKKFIGTTGSAQKTNTERAAERDQEIKNLEGTLAYLQTHPGKWKDAIKAIETTLARRRDEEKLLREAETRETPFDVRATYFSRSEGIPSGPLQIYGTCRVDRTTDPKVPRWHLTLRDTSRRFDPELLTIEDWDASFEAALEAVFVRLCSKYPDGHIALFAQELTDQGFTTRLIGFELATTSPGKKVREGASSFGVQMAIGVAAMFAMMFPPAIPFVIGITTLHQVVTTADQLHEYSTSGRLTAKRKQVAAVSLAMALLPGVRMAAPLTAGRGALFAMSAIEHLGNFVLFTEDVKEQLEIIEATKVGELAELYAELLQAQSATHESDPRRAELYAALDRRARSVGDALYEALNEATKSNVLMMVPGAVVDGAQLGGMHSHVPDGDVDPNGTHRTPQGDSVTPRDDSPPVDRERTKPAHEEHRGPIAREQREGHVTPPARTTDVERILEISADIGNDPLRAPGGVDGPMELVHLGAQIAEAVGGGTYAGEGVFVLDVGDERVGVRVKRVDKKDPGIRRKGDDIVLDIPKGLTGLQLEQVMVRMLTEARHQEMRRSRGLKPTEKSGLGPKGSGAHLSPEDMGKVAELRVLKRHLEEQLELGEAGKAAAAELERRIVEFETKLGVHETSPTGARRRKAVETQVAVQDDFARRSAAARKLEGEHGHPGIELHTHFMGIVKAEVFRDRAAAAAGSKDPTWIPLLEQIAALEDLPSSAKKPSDFKHDLNPDGMIKRRAPAGDAVKIAVDTVEQVKTLQKRAKLDADDSFLRAAEILAEDACQAALGATSETDFNSAYEIRDALVKTTFGAGKDGKAPSAQDRYDDLIRETILELARDGIGYVEASSSIKKLSGSLHPDRTRAVYAQLVKEGLILPGQVDIRMLGMTLTNYYGKRRKDLEKVRDVDSNEKDLRENRKQVRKDPGTVGDDIGGPENVDWNTASPEEFAKQYLKYARLAEETGVPFVFRPHVGEGSVDQVGGKPFNTDKHRHIDPSGEPSHYARARNNIERFLQGLEILAKDQKLDPSKVIVRMGHVAHATPDHAARMAKLGVIAEVNLGSNIATGSISQTDGPLGARRKHESLEDHSLPTLLFYGVRIVLSTDAGPVMQTTLRKEYQRAKQQIEEVLAGSRKIRVGADAARTESGTYRGTAVKGRPGEYDLTVTDLNPDEMTRFTTGYEKFYDDAHAYYVQRPKPDGATEHSLKGGAHHIDIAGQHGLVRGRGGAFLHEGVRSDVEAAATSYQSAGYKVVRQDASGVLIVGITSSDQTFTMTLRSWTSGDAAFQAPPESGDMRGWYDAQLDRIRALDAEWKASGIRLRERARRAFELRRQARAQAGDAIRGTDMFAVPTFEGLVDQLAPGGKRSKQAYEAIIKSASSSEAGYAHATSSDGGD